MHRVTWDGGWADVREPADVTVKGRRVVKQSLIPGVTILAKIEGGYVPSEDEVEVLDRIQVACLVALVAGWSLGGEVSRDTVEDLPGHVYDSLSVATKGEAAELLQSLHVDFSADPDPKAEAPTGG